MEIEIYDLNTIYKLPKVEWVIDGIIPYDSVAVIYGAPGSGKSFIALDMALHIANNKKWHNLNCNKSGIVVYILGEGLNGFPERIKTWHNYHNVPNTSPFYIIPLNGVSYYKEENMIFLIRKLDKIRQITSFPISMIIIDTISKAAIGLEENSSADMSIFLSGYEKLRIEFGSTLLFLHHCGKNVYNGMRGSSALLGNVDTTIFMDKTKKADKNNPFDIKFKVVKQKDGEEKILNFKLIKHDNSLIPIFTEKEKSNKSLLKRKLEQDRDISLSEEESEPIIAEKPKRSGKPWSTEDHKIFYKMIKKDYHTNKIAEKLNRTCGAIRCRLRTYVQDGGWDTIEEVKNYFRVKDNNNRHLIYLINKYQLV